MKTRDYISKRYLGKSFKSCNLNECALVNSARTGGIKKVFSKPIKFNRAKKL